MPPEPEFTDEDHEDVPFLGSETDSNTPTSDPRNNVNSGGQPNQHFLDKRIGLRLRFILFAMVLAVEVGFSFLDGPMVRIMESIACRQFYIQADPSKVGVDNQVPEELCKGAEVQAELAAVKGYHMFFDGLLSAILAFPYGLLADRQGRKSTLVLGIPGFTLNIFITVAVLWFSNIFPLRAIWLSSLAWLIGGGPVVAFAIIWTMMADVTHESERATLFFQFAIVSMGADFVSSALSSWLMTMNPWTPLFIGYGIVFVGFCLLWMLPETKNVLPASPAEAPTVELSWLAEASEPGHEFRKSRDSRPSHDNRDVAVHPDFETHMSWSYPLPQYPSLWTRFRANYRFYVKPYLFILNRKPVLLLLTAFLVYRLSRGSSWFLTQYISTRYHWTLAQSNLLVSFRPIVSIPLFLFGLPWFKNRLLSSPASSTEKDLWLARSSILCLTIGTLGIGLSPSIGILIPSLIVQTLGSGFVFLTRSIITTLVERDETARLYTVIEILQSGGNVVASLSITTVFQLGLRLGGFWIGLAWIMTSSLFCMVGAAIWIFRIPRSSANPEFVVGELDEED